MAIVVLSPLLLIAAADLLASSGWPLLFRQRRVGLDRREFDMFEFMTMQGQPDDQASLKADCRPLS